MVCHAEPLQKALRRGAHDAERNGNVNSRAKWSVKNAEQAFFPPVPGRNIVPSTVAVKCIGVKKLRKPEAVYNLTVADAEEYFANGLLVHNCTWVPGMASPDRLDAMTWGYTEVLLEPEPKRIRAWGR